MIREFLDTYIKKSKFIRRLNYSIKPQYKIFNRFELNENSIFLDFGANKGEVTQYVKDNFNPSLSNSENFKKISKKIGISKLYFNNLIYQSNIDFNIDWVHQND